MVETVVVRKRAGGICSSEVGDQALAPDSHGHGIPG